MNDDTPLPKHLPEEAHGEIVGPTFGLSKEERQDLFLELVREHGRNDSQVARMLGISRFTVITWKRDPEFKQRYKDARKIGLDHLIAEAERRAMNGSDKLLEFLLCNYAPDRFSRREKIEHTGGTTLTVVSGVPEPGEDLI